MNAEYRIDERRSFDAENASQPTASSHPTPDALLASARGRGRSRSPTGPSIAGAPSARAPSRSGEVVFNTSMTGYQEIVTDPSYAGQIVTMTYTQIGNVGVNPDDDEARRPFLSGFVVKELFDEPSQLPREGVARRDARGGGRAGARGHRHAGAGAAVCGISASRSAWSRRIPAVQDAAELVAAAQAGAEPRRASIWSRA